MLEKYYEIVQYFKSEVGHIIPGYMSFVHEHLILYGHDLETMYSFMHMSL